MTIFEKQEMIVKQFENCADWDDRYAKLIQMGRNLPPFPEDLRIDKNKLEGCQSQVWLTASINEGNVIFKADSDAAIVKGLIALLVEVYSNQPPEEILKTSPDFIKKIGIDNHLSPTRKNGLGAMLKQIQMFAFAFNAMSKK